MKNKSEINSDGNNAKPLLTEVLNSNNWICVNELMPEKNKIVLMFLPYCRHKFETGFFNGLYWLTVEGVKCKNVIYWADLNEKTTIDFDEDKHSKSLKSLNYNFAKENRSIAISFLEWINKQVDFKFVPSDNVYINITTGEKFSESKIYDVFVNVYGEYINLG